MNETYSADAIQVLSGLEAIRKRPGMYIGSTDRDGVRYLAWEVIGNVVNEHLGGAATALDVSVVDGWIAVRDDGVGIPVTFQEPYGMSALELILTTFRCGTGRARSPFEIRGVGLAVVNALSERIEIETTCGGVRWAQAYERGMPVTPLRTLGPTTRTGTLIRFRPDPTIFTGDIAADDLRDDLQRIAWLQPLLRVTFQEQRLVGTRGLPAWARELAAGPVLASADFAFRVGRTALEVALAWYDGDGTHVHAFVDHAPTPEGMHVLGLWKGLASWAAQLGGPPRKIAAAREVLGRGLVAVLHLSLEHPRFYSQTRTRLQSPEAANIVRAAFVRDGKHRFHWQRGPLQDFLRRRIGIALP